MLYIIRYSLLGLPLAALGLPFYLYVPDWLVQLRGFAYFDVAAIFLVARLIDVFTDIPVGAWVDRGAARRGVMWVGFALLLGAAWLLSTATHVGWVMLTVACLFLAWTLITVPWLVLPSLLSRRWHLPLNAAREAAVLVGTVLGLILPAVLGLTPGLVIGAVLLLLFGLILQPNAPRAVGGRLALAASLRLLRQDRAARALWGLWVVNALANAVPGVVLLVYCREVLQAEHYLALFLVAYFFSAIVSALACNRFAEGYGLLRLWRLGLLVSVIVFLPTATLGAGDEWWFLVCCLLTGACAGIDNVVPVTLQTRWVASRLDTANAAGVGFGFWGMGQKLAMGLAVALSYLVFGISDAANAGEGLNPTVVVSVYVLVPVLLKVLVLLLLAKPAVQQPIAQLEKRNVIA